MIMAKKSSRAFATDNDDNSNNRLANRNVFGRIRYVHITIGVACATLPTSSSFCMIFFIRACVFGEINGLV